MLLTGRSWRRIPAPNDVDAAKSSLPKILSAAGYDTFHVGKGGNEFKAGLASFDTSILMNDPEIEERRLASRDHADATIQFLKNRNASSPFYVYFAPSVPHDPRVAEPEFHALYDAERLPLSAAFMPLHPFDNGEMTVRDEKLAPWPRTEQDTRQQLADYYACISGLDHHVGRVLQFLADSGQIDNTIIVFTGDNGLSMGDHGLFGKQNLYEFGGMHVPLVFAGPGIPTGRRDALVYLMDLFPTFCDFAGAAPPDFVEGHSLRPAFEKSTIKVRDVLYTGYRDCMRSIRDDRWKLIRYPLVNQTQLFDLRKDPYELNNLADRLDSADKQADLLHQLTLQMQLYGDDTPLVVANPRSPKWVPQ
jgi:arylsulfatase A-like enzyme